MATIGTQSPLPHHMRIAALQANYEGGWAQTLRVPATWQRMGFNVEQLYHAYATGYQAVYRAASHRRLLTRYLAESRRRGQQVILYVNCHILMGPEVRNRGRWAQVDRQGKYHRPYGTYYSPCLNSAWRQYFLDLIAGLKGMDLAGIFFDGPTGLTCFCPRCEARFRRETGRSLRRAGDTEANAFAGRVFKEFCRLIYDAVKAVDPRWISYTNFDVMNPDADAAEMEALLALNDIVGTEGGFFFYGPPAGAAPWRPGLMAKLAEAAARGKPTVIFMAGDHKPWSWYLHTPAETTLCYASSLANGASLWYGIHGPTRLLGSPAGQAARAVVQFDRRHDRFYRRTESVADVAILFSYDTNRWYRKSAGETDLYRTIASRAAGGVGNYSESFQGAVAMLTRSGVPFDVVTELNLGGLSRYRMLVLPTAACVGDGLAAALRAFVSSGGTILADSEFSLYDSGMRRRTDFGLADLAGARFKGYRKYQSHDYFSFDPTVRPAGGAPLVPAPLAALDVEPARGARVIARLCPPLPGRYWGAPGTPIHPFILRRKAGRGTVYFIAGTFFELYGTYGIEEYRWFVADLLHRHARPPARIEEMEGLVEVTARRSLSGDRDMRVHLVNYTGAMTRPIERVTPLRDVRVRLGVPARGAKALVSGRMLRIGRDGCVVVPELKEFEVLRVGGT